MFQVMWIWPIQHGWSVTVDVRMSKIMCVKCSNNIQIVLQRETCNCKYLQMCLCNCTAFEIVSLFLLKHPCTLFTCSTQMQYTHAGHSYTSQHFSLITNSDIAVYSLLHSFLPLAQCPICTQAFCTSNVLNFWAGGTFIYYTFHNTGTSEPMFISVH